MTQTQPNMCMTESRNRRAVDIELTVLSALGNGDFRMSSPNGPHKLPIENDYVLKFNNNQGGTYQPGFQVKFRLADDSLTRKYRFPEDLDDALWVKLLDHKGPCPSRSGNPGGVFDPVRLEDEGRTLVVDNPNEAEQMFGFALRVVPIAGGKTLTYDPIGSNQNGQNFER